MMRRQKWEAGVLVLGLVVAGAGLAQAAESVLGVVPDDALGFAVVNRLAETDAKIQKLVRTLEMPAPGPLVMFKATFGIQKGLNEQASAAVIALPSSTPGPMPAIVVALPVTDHEAFVGPYSAENVTDAIAKIQVGDRAFLVGEKKGYALVAETSQQAALEKVLAGAANIGSSMAAWEKWIEKNDVAVVMTRPGLKRFFEQVQNGLRQGRETFPADNPQAAQVKAALDMYLEGIDMVRNETTLVGFGMSVKEGGDLVVSTRGQVAPGGALAKMIEEMVPREGNALAGLPNGPFAVAMAGALPEALSQKMTEFSVSMMRQMGPTLYRLNEEQTKKLGALSLESMKGVRGMAMMLGETKPDGSLYDNMIGVMWTDDSEAYMARYRKLMAAMKEIAKDAKDSPFQSMAVERTEVEGREALKVTMDVSGMFAAMEMPQQQKLLERMYGPGGKITAYLAPADDKTIVFCYSDKKNLARGIEAVKKPEASLAADEGVARTAKLLPAKAPYVGYVSPKGMIDLFKSMAAVTMPAEAVPQVPDFPETSPIGFAATTDNGGVRKVLVVPADVLKALGKYIAELRPAQAL